MFRPLKVSATLASSIAGEVPMLDALLEYQMAHRCDPAHLAKVQPDGEHVPGTLPIPLARRRVSGFEWPIPVCSSPICRVERDGREHFARRFDPDPAVIAPDERKVFASNSGEFRSYRLPLRVRLIERVAWFCVGEAHKVRALLKDVKYLGKKTSQGFGRVMGWTVEHTDIDAAWFAESEAGPVLMRPLPLGDHLPAGFIGSRRWFGGIVPPYWDRRYMAEAVVPC